MTNEPGGSTMREREHAIMQPETACPGLTRSQPLMCLALVFVIVDVVQTMPPNQPFCLIQIRRPLGDERGAVRVAKGVQQWFLPCFQGLRSMQESLPEAQCDHAVSHLDFRTAQAMKKHRAAGETHILNPQTLEKAQRGSIPHGTKRRA